MRGIFSTAYRIHKNNPCEDGRQRGLDALAKHGYGPFTQLPLTFCLEHVGFLDTLFSLGFVDPSCKKQANEALARFRRDIVLPLNPPDFLLEIAEKRIRGAQPTQAQRDEVEVLRSKSYGDTLAMSVIKYILCDIPPHVAAMELSQVLLNTEYRKGSAGYDIELKFQRDTLMQILRSYEA